MLKYAYQDSHEACPSISLGLEVLFGICDRKATFIGKGKGYTEKLGKVEAGALKNERLLHEVVYIKRTACM